MPVEYAVDANVILRFLLRDSAALSEKAETAFRAMEAGEVTLVCDPVNLAEAVWTMSSYYKVPHHEIAGALLPLVRARGFHLPDKERYVRALELHGERGIRFGDACACATAEDACEGRLLSFDRGLSRVPGIARTETATAR